MRKNIKEINGKTIYLKPLSEKNASQEYCNWLNDPEVNKYLETRKSTIKDLEEYIKKQINNPDSIFLGIFDKNNDNHIGNIKLTLINRKKNKADFGILIGNKEYWGRGIGVEATKLATNFALYSLGVSEIELGVIRENKRAIKTFTKSGFKITGIREKCMDHDDVLYDQVIMIKKVKIVN